MNKLNQSKALAARGEAVALLGAKGRSLEEQIEAVNHAVFNEFGLKGNVQDYYAAGNSLLHVILETKKGIPISMALLWALVARRAGVCCNTYYTF
jgi:regulator of sirC expression with transglutaminase-like and TPR domain